jgi:hypothetical protein
MWGLSFGSTSSFGIALVEGEITWKDRSGGIEERRGEKISDRGKAIVGAHFVVRTTA